MAKPAVRTVAKRTPAKASPPRAPLLEWIVAAAGLLFILAAIGVVVAAELAGGRQPPELAVRLEAVSASHGGWRVAFEARNTGREAAADVQVTGRLLVAGEEIESRSVVLDYLPGGARRNGGLLFRHDPRTASLELAAEGYREP